MQSWWMLLGALPVTENQGFFKYKLFHVLINNSAGSPAKEPSIELCYRKKDSSYINFVTTDRPHGVTLLTYLLGAGFWFNHCSSWRSQS